MDYQDELKKLAELASEDNLSLYDLGKLLTQLRDDPEFKADCDRRGVTVDVELDNLLSDSAFNFHDMQMMLRHFPNRAAWKDQDLSKLYNHALAASIIEVDAENAELRAKITRMELDKKILEMTVNDGLDRLAIAEQLGIPLKRIAMTLDDDEETGTGGLSIYPQE